MSDLSTKKYCKALRIDGQPCRAWPSKTTGYCPLHSPNRRQIQVAGGKARTRAHMLETRMNPKLKEMVELLRIAAYQVYRKEITPAQGSAIAAIATALIKATEATELALRLSILEVRLTDGRWTDA